MPVSAAAMSALTAINARVAGGDEAAETRVAAQVLGRQARVQRQQRRAGVAGAAQSGEGPAAAVVAVGVEVDDLAAQASPQKAPEQAGAAVAAVAAGAARIDQKRVQACGLERALQLAAVRGHAALGGRQRADDERHPAAHVHPAARCSGGWWPMASPASC